MEQKQVLQEKENILFNRREIKILVESPTSPSMKQSQELIAKNLSSSEELIKVNKIKGKFGRNTFLINCDIYKTEEDRLKHDLRYKEEKKKLDEERMKAEAEKLKQEEEAKAKEEEAKKSEEIQEQTQENKSEEKIE